MSLPSQKRGTLHEKEGKDRLGRIIHLILFVLPGCPVRLSVRFLRFKRWIKASTVKLCLIP
jgi:hypothetical protein